MSFRSADLLKLVEGFGSQVTLRKTTTSGTYNPATGSLSGTVVTNYTVKAYFFNFSVGLPVGDQITKGVSRCVIPALGLAVEPDDEDEIVGLGKTYGIESVDTIYSNGVAVCYICEVRK
jgi:hypothetical protein